MEIYIIIAVVVAGFIIYEYSISKDIHEKSNNVTTKVNNLKNFNLKQRIDGIKNLFTFAIDEENRRVVYVDHERVSFIPFDNIVSVEYLEDNITIASKSTMRTIGGAIIGSAIAGSVGAVVGGLSGDTEIKRNVKLVQVRIIIRELASPTLLITCYDRSIMEVINPVIGIEKARKIKDIVSIIIDEADRNAKHADIISKTQCNSVADELSKLSELKEKGVLTEEEFIQQKQKLLR